MSVVVTDLARQPASNPSSHSSGLNGCPAVAGDTGYDYGTRVYFALPAENWAAGRYRPRMNETDCIDLVVTTFTPNQIAFHFGPFHTSQYPKFSLAPGIRVQVGINGATSATTVSYR